MNITKINARIKRLKGYGIGRDEILELLADLEDFDPNLVTKTGYITKSKEKLNNLPIETQNILEEIIPTVSEIKKDTSENNLKDAVDEYFSKKDIDSMLAAFRSQYYDIVEKIAHDLGVTTDKAEALLSRMSRSTKAGDAKGTINRMVDFGRSYRDIKNADSTYTYRQAKKDLIALSKDTNRLYANVGEFLLKQKGVI